MESEGSLIVDGQTLQGLAHLRGAPDHDLEPGARLARFLELARGVGLGHRFLEPGARFTRDVLDRARVVAVPTREGAPYGGEEVDLLAAFVEGGGGLWVMSNHDPYHRESAPLIEPFGLALEGTFFHTKGGVTVLGPPLLDRHHPVLAGGGAEGRGVERLVTNTVDSIVPGPARVLARLPAGLNDRRPNPLPSEGRAFAAALDLDGGGGRLLVTADSGMFGSAGTGYPGYGLVDRGHNEAFVENALRWLGRMA